MLVRGTTARIFLPVLALTALGVVGCTSPQTGTPGALTTTRQPASAGDEVAGNATHQPFSLAASDRMGAVMFAASEPAGFAAEPDRGVATAE